MRSIPLVLLTAACVDQVGYSVTDTGWFQTDPAELLGEALPCDAVSIEPDDLDRDEDISMVGVVSEAPRTLCGEVAGSGDADFLGLQLLDGARVVLELIPDDPGDDLLLQLYLYESEEWIVADADGLLSRRLDAGSHVLAVTAGRDTGSYRLVARLDPG